MMKFIIFLTVFVCSTVSAELKARAYIFKASNSWPSGDQQTIGAVDFVQKGNSVYVNGTLYELSPGKHGFHVHQFADLSNNCLATGGHFNPHNNSHGAPSDSNRHVGDLGNIDATGSSTIFEMTDNVIALHGENSIIGRALVIHVGEDDLGKGGHPDSLTTGHAGSRFACGVIGLVEEPSSSSPVSSLALALISPIILYFAH